MGGVVFVPLKRSKFLLMLQIEKKNTCIIDELKLNVHLLRIIIKLYGFGLIYHLRKECKFDKNLV